MNLDVELERLLAVRELTPIEEERLAALTARSVDYALLEPTQTGLEKSILDATAPVREFLSRASLHDYEQQKQGPEYKVVINATLLKESIEIPSKASLYRPQTKNGDPRIWFKNLPSFADSNDIIAITIYGNSFYLINITKSPIVEILQLLKPSPISDLVNEINQKSTLVSEELLAKLKEIARAGLARSVITTKKADTAVGRTLETLLGIAINSRKEPDYKGIELKSYRSKEKGSDNRKTLYGQVPDWRVSKLKSSRQIAEHFGYQSEKRWQLNCTVSTQNWNSQGLRLLFDQDKDQLIETSRNPVLMGDFAVWLLPHLRNRLAEKHQETFWVKAKSHMIDGVEHFEFKEVFHTKKPIVSQFDLLLKKGEITLDHLSKINEKGRFKERGPLFKIKSSSLEQLFPPSKTYKLIEK